MGQTQTATATDDRNHTVNLETLSSPTSKLVYLYLYTGGEATVSEICDQLDIDHLTAFPVLDTLIDHGMVEKCDGTYAVTAS